jgi:hypothetical protein
MDVEMVINGESNHKVSIACENLLIFEDRLRAAGMELRVRAGFTDSSNCKRKLRASHRTSGF